MLARGVGGAAEGVSVSVTFRLALLAPGACTPALAARLGDPGGLAVTALSLCSTLFLFPLAFALSALAVVITLSSTFYTTLCTAPTVLD